MVGAGAVGATGRPRRGVGATGLGTTRRDGGLGTTSRPATVERRPGKNAAAHAGERAGAARRSRGRRGDVDLNWAAPKGVICWGVLG